MSKNKTIHLPSDDKKGDRWHTPKKEIFDPLDSVFNFWLDAASQPDNCLVANHADCIEDDYNYFDLYVEDYKDGLENCSIFINPPYSNITPFIKKAWEDAKHFRVVMLLKADMSTDWFNKYLKSNYVHLNQEDMTLELACRVLVNQMMKEQTCDNCQYIIEDKPEIGILHLRKRVRHHVSEEVFLKDARLFPEKIKSMRELNIEGWENYDDNTEYETKHYKRVEDGIVAKGGSNFPSMIVVLDRRGN